MISGIYRIYNVASDKSYIGQAQDLSKRRAGHFYRLRLNKHGNNHLQNAFNKYGESNFYFQILENVSVDELNIKEQCWIDYYGFDSLYNLCPTAGSSRGRKPTDETKQKIGAAMLGRKHTDETRAKISAAKRAHKHSEEAIKKMGKPVKQLDRTTGEVLRVFDSVKEATQNVGLKSSNSICDVIAGRSPTAGGYKWQYA